MIQRRQAVRCIFFAPSRARDDKKGCRFHPSRKIASPFKVQLRQLLRRPETIQRPKTSDQRPTTNDQRPKTNDQRPKTNDQRPKTNDQRPKTKLPKNKTQTHP
jgi:DNA mismatch repair ATPase MutL